MRGGKDRADRFAGGASTLLAQHRLKWRSLYLGIRAFPQTFYADPVLGAAITSIFFAHKRKIVLHRTCGNASLTSRAYILVNDHSPFAFSFLCNDPFCTDKIWINAHSILL